jgi:hypothetical protein
VEILIEELREQGRPVDPRLEALATAPKDESDFPMVIALEPAEGSAAPG